MENSLNALQDTVRALLPSGGTAETGFSGLTACRFTDRTVPMPKTTNPYLYLVLDGTLRLYTPSGIMDYAPGQYSVSQIDTPLSGTVLSFSEHEDFLALVLEFSVSDVIAWVLELDNDLVERITGDRLTEEEQRLSDRGLLSVVYRLMSGREQAVPSVYMERTLLREVIYHVLCGSCGKQFLQSVAQVGRVDEIYKANSWIKENFRDPFTVEKLAEEWNMSVSLFHQKFKSAVGMGPLQCQKRLRLTEAKRLMLDEGRNVTGASLEVGYESLSQFIRDYKKMFGLAPKEDILRLRRQWKE